MHDKYNEASEVIREWQDKFQKAISDPKSLELLLEYQNRLQEILIGNKEHEQKSTSREGSKHDVSADFFDAVLELAKRVEKLETKIQNLEQAVSRNTKASD